MPRRPATGEVAKVPGESDRLERRDGDDGDD